MSCQGNGVGVRRCLGGQFFVGGGDSLPCEGDLDEFLRHHVAPAMYGPPVFGTFR